VTDREARRLHCVHAWALAADADVEGCDDREHATHEACSECGARCARDRAGTIVWFEEGAVDA
jgi:hypothetical protein